MDCSNRQKTSQRGVVWSTHHIKSAFRLSVCAKPRAATRNLHVPSSRSLCTQRFETTCPVCNLSITSTTPYMDVFRDTLQRCFVFFLFILCPGCNLVSVENPCKRQTLRCTSDGL